MELIDLEKQMEEQLFMQHRDVERVVARKTAEDGNAKYLVKVRLSDARF